MLGGMGPAASADFVARLVAAVPAARDTDHPRILLDSDPGIPDRNAALAGGPSPGPALAAMARGLAAQGAEVLAMPCNAAHAWADHAAAATPARFVSLINAAADAAAATGARTVAVLGVAATLDSGLYARALSAHGITAVEPNRAALTAVVARVKAGERGPALAADAAVLADTQADLALLACTELSLALGTHPTRVPVLDATAALVAATLAAARISP